MATMLGANRLPLLLQVLAARSVAARPETVAVAEPGPEAPSQP